MADSVSGETGMETLRENWDTAKAEKQVELIVDGGTENNNYVVDNFIKSTGVDITKSVVLKGILFPNLTASGRQYGRSSKQTSQIPILVSQKQVTTMLYYFFITGLI